MLVVNHSFQTAGHTKFTILYFPKLLSKKIFRHLLYSSRRLLLVILKSYVYLNFSFHHLSSPDGWSCQAAQTIHHLGATLSNVPALPLLLLQHPFPPASRSPLSVFFIIFSSFLTHLSAQIDFPSPYLCISFLYSPTLGLLIPISPLRSPSLHHHSCMLPPLPQPLLTCLYV